MKEFKLHHGDCLEVLRGMADNSVDSIVTDPPYGLSFMGKKWDYDVPAVEVWTECLRVLKPGGHLLAFAGTRTQHRMAVRIEDAGFEIRDMIAWVYGSGFPKSHNLQGDWQGWGTALKPALEPITVARKPLGTRATNVLKMVESQLRERGVRGEILWKPESASGAAKSKKTTGSGSTAPSERLATSAKTADESVTPSAERQSLKSSERLGTSGLNQIRGVSGSFQGCTTSDCAHPSSLPMGGSAPAAESVSATFSPLTTSTAEEPSTASKFMGRCTPNCAETDSHPDTESFAGIATGLTGSMETVRINRDSEGFFLWPKGLPEFVPGSPLTVAENVLAHGTGALNIDGCRVPAEKATGWGGGGSKLYEGGLSREGGEARLQDAGRWPANLIHDGSDDVVAGFPQALGQQGALTGKEPSSKTANAFGDFAARAPSEPRGDTGSAARFFYCAKASKRDRDEGLEGFELGNNMRVNGPRESEEAKHATLRANIHPTVKPTDLMRYLCRLVTPPGGTVLDCYTGSGSTGKAAILEGFNFIGIEREAEYLEIASARIQSAITGYRDPYTQSLF